MNMRHEAALWADLDLELVDSFFEQTGAIEHTFKVDGEYVGHLTLIPSLSIHYGPVLSMYTSIKPSKRYCKQLLRAMLKVANTEAKRCSYRFLSRSKHITSDTEIVYTREVK